LNRAGGHHRAARSSRTPKEAAMTQEEIRALVAGTVDTDWYMLSGDAPSYFNRFVDLPAGDAHYLAHAEHASRAVLRADLDVGLVWGMRDPSSVDGSVEALWTKSLQPAVAQGHVVEVLYRGQPVEREVYASVEDARGIVPWPTPRYPGAAASDRHAPPVWEVTHWQLDLVLLLADLGAPAGAETVQRYLHRCAIAVVE
jgi:hypothetical protein